jgi:hypoxanthine phosphoribosyltransferase
LFYEKILLLRILSMSDIICRQTIKKMNKRKVVAIVDVGLIVGVISGIFGAAGIFLAIQTKKESKELKRAPVSLSWFDVPNAAKHLAKEVRRAEFSPDVIFTPDIKGGIIAQMVEEDLVKQDNRIPTLVGIVVAKGGRKISDSDSPESFVHFSTDNWELYVPKELFSDVNRKILIIDDFCMTGNLLYTLRANLVGQGVPKDNIKIACVVTTKIARETRNLPNYFWKETTESFHYFPWGIGGQKENNVG